GLSSPLQDFLLVNLARLPWPARLRWLSVLGVEHAVAFQELAWPELRQEGEQDLGGARTRLYAVASPAPRAWWPDATRAAASPIDALRAVQTLDDPLRTVVLAREVPQTSGGTVAIERDEPDHLELSVQSSGGVVVVRRNYDPLLAATVDGQPVETV